MNILNLLHEIIEGKRLNASELLSLLQIDAGTLLSAAALLKNHFFANKIELCSIVNAKSGACPEDCSFCAQSSKATSQASIYPLLKKDVVLQKAMEAKKAGVSRFCIVTSGRKVSHNDLMQIAEMISEIRNIGLSTCATLGLLQLDELLMLKEAGLQRYHHNLETSKRFFPEICRTHSYEDKLETISNVKKAGLSLCCGGIFGMGETWQDRIDMALSIREAQADSVPINFLIPIRGTKMQSISLIEPIQYLKVIALYRFAMPDMSIRVCAGRVQALSQMHPMIFYAGCDAILTGNYLTTIGRSYDDDLKLLKINELDIKVF